MNNLKTHIFIEFYYRHGKFLNEHNSKLSFRELNESYGVFNGCNELAKEIYNRIKEIGLKNGENRVIALNLKNHKWIDTIEVYLYTDEVSNVGASYNSSSKIVFYGGLKGNQQKFSPLKLNVNLNHKNIVISLMHELTHAYEDYNRRTNKKPSLSDKALDNGYYLNNPVGVYDNEKKYISYILY